MNAAVRYDSKVAVGAQLHRLRANGILPGDAGGSDLRSAELTREIVKQNLITERQENTVAYELPPLPYDYAALEPTIDEATMKLHHDKHHQTYVTNLNGAVEKHPELGKKTPEELVKDLASIPEDVRKVVRNNGGGHVNHTMFWQIMRPKRRRRPYGRDRRADQGRLRRRSRTSRSSSTRRRRSSSARAGAGWSSTAAS